MARLADKVAIVTGGASGLGKAIVERFAQEGSKVVVADLNEDAGQEIASSVGGLFVKTDVTDAAAVEALVAQAVAQYGRLDIMVNNAGIDGVQAPIAEADDDNWHKVIDINLNGVYYGMKHGIAAMLKAGNGGSVINMASIAGMVGFANIPPIYSLQSGSHQHGSSGCPRVRQGQHPGECHLSDCHSHPLSRALH